MKSICIKTNNKKQIEYLLRELRETEMKNICFTLRQFKHYKNIIIHYNGKEIKQFYSLISTILSLLVIDELEEGFLKRNIIREYFYFNKIEQKEILDICYRSNRRKFFRFV